MAPQRYRLQAMLTLREKEKEAAEKELARAQKRLHDEEAALEALQQKLKDHKELIKHFRKEWNEKALSGAMTIGEVQGHGNYLHKLKEQEKEINEEILRQKERVMQAHRELLRAKSAFLQAATELRKLEKHKEAWAKKLARERERKEELANDEIGTNIHNYAHNYVRR